MDLIVATAERKNAKVGEIDEIKKLIENGSDVNYIDDHQHSLTMACKKGRLDIIKILYKAGAKYQEVEFNRSPLEQASYYGYVNIVKYLIKKYVISEEDIKHSISCAVYRNNIDVLDYFLTLGYNLNFSPANPLSLGYNLNFSPANPLSQACENKNIDAIDRLLNASAQRTNVNGYSYKPLIYRMVECNRLDIIKRLVMFGGDINASYDSYTPIMAACIRNYTEVVEFLIEMGCDVNCPNDALQTPLMYSCINNNLEIVKLLIKYKADIDFLDKNGKKAIDYANNEIKVYLTKN